MKNPEFCKSPKLAELPEHLLPCFNQMMALYSKERLARELLFYRTAVMNLEELLKLRKQEVADLKEVKSNLKEIVDSFLSVSNTVEEL